MLSDTLPWVLVNGMAILANALGQSISATGTTIFRPSYTPTTFGAIAGRDISDLFDPERYTAAHRWHTEQGAEFEDVGQWKRPWYFPRGNETMHEAVNRECLAVRKARWVKSISKAQMLLSLSRECTPILTSN